MISSSCRSPVARSLTRTVYRSSPVVSVAYASRVESGLIEEPPREKNSCPSRELVEVEQQLLAREGGLVGRAVLVGSRGSPVVLVANRDPAAGAVLPALEGPRVVPVAAVADRHREVRLPRAGLDLLEDRLPQVREVGGARLRVVVLGLQVRRHLRLALAAEPLVVVDPGAAMVGAGDAVLGGDGGFEGRRVRIHAAQAIHRALASTRAHLLRSPARPDRRAHRRPQRRPRRGGHRRRRAAGDRDQRQRGVRLPRRDSGHHARGVCGGGPARGLGRGTGVLRRPGELREGRPRRGLRRPAGPGRGPGGGAGRDRRRGGASGCATSSRTGRSTTG